jgi:hypothetical protein
MSQRDFGILPIPSYLKHVEGREVQFGVLKNVILGVFATFSESSFLRFMQTVTECRM